MVVGWPALGDNDASQREASHLQTEMTFGNRYNPFRAPEFGVNTNGLEERYIDCNRKSRQEFATNNPRFFGSNSRTCPTRY
jgi:hypothetical protein